MPLLKDFSRNCDPSRKMVEAVCVCVRRGGGGGGGGGKGGLGHCTDRQEFLHILLVLKLLVKIETD